MTGNNLLQITPSSLTYLPPYTLYTSQTLKIQNLTDQSVAFKIRTTAPKRYSVKPIFAVLSPQETKDVLVQLNALKDAPTESTKDCFQIQAAIFPNPPEGSDQTTELKNFWANVDPKQIAKYKVRTSFSPSSDSTDTPAIQESETGHLRSSLELDMKDFFSNSVSDLRTLTQNIPQSPSPSSSSSSSSQPPLHTPFQQFDEIQKLVDQIQKIRAERDGLKQELERLGPLRSPSPSQNKTSSVLSPLSIGLCLLALLIPFLLSFLGI